LPFQIQLVPLRYGKEYARCAASASAALDACVAWLNADERSRSDTASAVTAACRAAAARAGDQCGGHDACVEPIMRGFYAHGLSKRDLSAQLGRRAGKTGSSATGAGAADASAPARQFDEFGNPAYLAASGAHLRAVSAREREFVRLLNAELKFTPRSVVVQEDSVSSLGRLRRVDEGEKSVAATSSQKISALNNLSSSSTTTARWTLETKVTRFVGCVVAAAAFFAAALFHIRKRRRGGSTSDTMPLLQPRRARPDGYGAVVHE
jgi:hypothetical protein